MPNRPSEYQRPADLTTARALLRRSDTAPILIGPRPEPETYLSAESVVDLRALGLDNISENSGRITIGGQTTLQALIDSPVIRSLANGLVPQAAALAAHFGLRHIATLHGALATPEGPPELRLALLALNASVRVEGEEKLTLAVSEFESDLHELLLDVSLDRLPAAGGALARVARSPLDAAIVAAVAVVTPTSARVAVAGASASPLTWALAGGPFEDDDFTQLADAITLAADPVPDYRGSVEYRKAMAGVLAHRALHEAWKKL